MSKQARTPKVAAMMVALAMVAAACTDSGDAAEDRNGGAGLEIEVVSSHPTAVTGGDTVLSVSGADAAGELSVTLDGEELATEDAPEPANGRDLGAAVVVSGLPDGDSTLLVTAQSADGADRSGEIEVTNHPRSGPVFSGERFTMTRCSTEAFGLGRSELPNCDAPTRFAWRYVDAEGAFQDLEDPTEDPTDARMVELADGTERPLIIRDEFGVINRSPYQISLFDPAPSGASDGGPLDASGWNGRLVYRFGGGCGTSYTQGFFLLGQTPPDLFAQGYATATSTFNTFQVMCDDVLSAETTSMVKEHFAKTVGTPVVTIGEGGSGGAIQQYLIAQNYPGLLDAIGPTLPFPDAMSISAGVLDCSLLARYFEGPGKSLSTEQRAAIADQLSAQTCGFWDTTFATAVDPTRCGLDLVAGLDDVEVVPGQRGGFITPPAEDVFDVDDNPDGVRCTLQDANVNQVGIDPDTGWARRPWDNVGVAYGLSALNDGAITADEFLDLNERIGSYDLNGELQKPRAEAESEALEAVYRGGRINLGGGDLTRIPIISVNIYTDPQGDIHDRFRVFSVRERLARDGKPAANSVIWTRGVPEGDGLVDALTGGISLGTQLIELLDEWATEIARVEKNDRPDDDRPGGERAELVEGARPEDAVDTCWDAAGKVLARGDAANENPACADVYPTHGDPRTGAGAPLSNDIMKCATRPVADALADDTFTADFNDDQRRRLGKIFDDGMCDYSVEAIGVAPIDGTWQSY